MKNKNTNKNNNLPKREQILLNALKKSPQSIADLHELIGNNPAEYISRLRKRAGICIYTQYKKMQNTDGEFIRYGVYHLIDCEEEGALVA